MKKYGARMELSDERITDLMRAFDSYMETIKDFKGMSDVYSAVVSMPSSRFWVSDHRVSTVIAAMLRGENVTSCMRPTKRAMYREICRRVRVLQRSMPQATVSELCRRVVMQPAPRFYLMPGSAKTMICKARRQWKGKKF